MNSEPAQAGGHAVILARARGAREEEAAARAQKPESLAARACQVPPYGPARACRPPIGRPTVVCEPVGTPRRAKGTARARGGGRERRRAALSLSLRGRCCFCRGRFALRAVGRRHAPWLLFGVEEPKKLGKRTSTRWGRGGEEKRAAAAAATAAVRRRRGCSGRGRPLAVPLAGRA